MSDSQPDGPAHSPVTNAFTVDLEDWYHGLTRTNRQPERWVSLPSRAEATASLLLDLLEEAGVRATFFVLGDLARKAPRLIQRIAQAGHELGSHGYSHRPVYRLTPRAFLKELMETCLVIQDAAGAPVAGYRAPYFSIDQRSLWAFEVLSDAGYAYDSSVFPMRSLIYGYPGASRTPYRPIPGADLVEYPVATLRIAGLTLPAAGGFYYRMAPYPLIRWVLARLNRQDTPAVLYMHPWELDRQQPRIPVSPRERLTHYSGRTGLSHKLRRLCQDFRLAPLAEVHREWLSRN